MSFHHLPAGPINPRDEASLDMHTFIPCKTSAEFGELHKKVKERVNYVLRNYADPPGTEVSYQASAAEPLQQKQEVAGGGLGIENSDVISTFESISAQYRSLFSLSGKHEIWPMRLLHIPSMTSYERQEGNSYGGNVEPKYNILSYTWGRYEVESGPAIQVGGITWKVPSIDPARFTVDQFQGLIDMCGMVHDFIWIDVACIDQQNDELKMTEIGNQAGIFNKADKCIIWLHSLDTGALQEIWWALIRAHQHLEESTIPISLMSDKFPVPRSQLSEEQIEHFISYEILQYALMELNILPCLGRGDWIKVTLAALRRLTDDPWFSSLWTLQEAHLRTSATVISKDLKYIKVTGSPDTGLFDLLWRLQEIDRAIKAALKNKEFVDGITPAMFEALQQIPICIKQLPISTYDNPVTLYSTASARTCRDPHDRIYGIMQVFGLRLGKSADSSQTYSLEGLEAQFAAELNTKSPMWAQLFSHSETATAGNAWRVSKSCYVPEEMRPKWPVPFPQSSITMDSNGRGWFNGHIGFLSGLSTFFHECKTWKQVFLDNSQFARDKIPEHLRAPAAEDSPNHEQTVAHLLAVKDETFFVLLLGHFLDAGPGNGHQIEHGNWIITAEVGGRARKSGKGYPKLRDEDGNESEYPPSCCMGLLCRSVKFDFGPAFERIGVMFWPPGMSEMYSHLHAQPNVKYMLG